MERPKVKSRRTHRKSRGGCLACKKRRIKCDEVKPCCSNCMKHSKLCSFNDDRHSDFSKLNMTGAISLTARMFVKWNLDQDKNGAPPPASFRMSVSETSMLENPFDVSLSDLQLLHHYMASVSRLFGTSQDNLNFWQHEVPEVGFQHLSILRLILALAAYHQASIDFDGRIALTKRANELFDAGAQAQAATITRIDKGNSMAVFLGVLLIQFCTFAAGPRPEDYLGFSSNDSPAAMTRLLRGMRAIMHHANDAKAAEMLMQTSTIILDRHEEVVRDTHSQHDPPAHFKAFQHLRTYFTYPTIAPREKQVAVYAAEIDKLEQIFSAVISKDAPHNEHLAIQYGHLMVSWLYRLTEEYTTLLEHRQPPALIIFAHFAVLMKYFDSLWILKGWPEHVVAGVYDHLPPVDRVWLEWPMAEIKSVPP